MCKLNAFHQDFEEKQSIYPPVWIWSPDESISSLPYLFSLRRCFAWGIFLEIISLQRVWRCTKKISVISWLFFLNYWLNLNKLLIGVQTCFCVLFFSFSITHVIGCLQKEIGLPLAFSSVYLICFRLQNTAQTGIPQKLKQAPPRCRFKRNEDLTSNNSQ